MSGRHCRKNQTDLCGQRFGKLTILRFAEYKDECRWWECQCDCGKAILTTTGRLRGGFARTCKECPRDPSHGFIDLTGRRFGYLIVLRRAPIRRGKAVTYWLCRCDCGKEKEIPSSCLRKGKSKSCGCRRGEHDPTGKIQRVLGKPTGQSRAYKSYMAMMDRCYKPKNSSYSRYGKRGIRVCRRWRESFLNFYADMGEPASGLTLDRIDNDGNYMPSNCRWATRSQQQWNRSNTALVTYKGETKCVGEWAQLYGIHYDTLLHRLQRGWTTEEALTRPSGPKQMKE